MGIFSIFGNVKKHTAAMNALVAKGTYAQLDSLTRNAVDNRTVEILEKGWRFSKEYAAEFLKTNPERITYGFIALAMLELNIKPISKNWEWQIVPNPGIALDKGERQIEVARFGLRDREGIEINLVEGEHLGSLLDA